jgi:hypothetical protein
MPRRIICNDDGGVVGAGEHRSESGVRYTGELIGAIVQSLKENMPNISEEAQ